MSCRPTVLVWTKRRFRCRRRAVFRSFTESPARWRRGAVWRPGCARAIALAAVDRSDGGGGAVVPGGLGDGVAGHRRGGAGQAPRRPVGRRGCWASRDDVPSLQEFHDRPGGLGEFPVVGLHRGSVQESWSTVEALGEGVHSIGRVVIDPYAGYKPGARRGAAGDPRRPLPHRGSRQRGAHRRANPDANRKSPATAARKGDPLWSMRHDLLRAREHLTDHRGVPSGLVGRTRMRRTLKEMLRDRRADRAAAEAALADSPPRPRLRRRRDEPPRQDPPRLGTRCSPTSTPASPTGPPKASTGSSKPSNAKASATQRRQLPHPRPLPLRLTHSTHARQPNPPCPTNRVEPY